MLHHLISQSKIDIVDAIYNGVLIIDKEGKIIKCNKTGCELSN